MLIETERLDALPNDSVNVAAVLALASCAIHTWKGKNSAQEYMISVFEELWPYAEGTTVIFDKVSDKFSESVTELHYELDGSPLDGHIYAIFALSFNYCLWIIEGSNRRNGIPTHGSEETAEVDPSYISRIAENTTAAGLLNESQVEQYFAQVISRYSNPEAGVRREDLANLLAC